MLVITKKKMTIVLLSILELILFLVASQINTHHFDNWMFGMAVMIMFTIVSDIICMMRLNIKLYSPAAMFVFMLFLFNFGQVFLNAFFKNYFYRYENVFSPYFRDKSIETLRFCYIIIQLIFLSIIIQRKEKRYHSISIDTVDEIKKVRYIGIIISCASIPTWIYSIVYTYRISLIKTSYVATSVNINGMVRSISYFITIGFSLLIIGNSQNERRMKKIFLIEAGALVLSMITGGRLFSVACLCVIFYVYKKCEGRTSGKGVLKTLIIGFFFIGLVTSISNLRLNEAITIKNVSRDFVHNGINSVLYALEEFGGTFKTTLKIFQQVPAEIAFANGVTYFKSFITVFPTISPEMHKIYQESIFLYYLRNVASMGGSFIGELYFNYGYFAFVFAIIIGLIIGKITDITDELLSCKEYYKFSFYIMIILGMYLWIRGYFVEMIRGPIWGAIIIYITRIIFVRDKKIGILNEKRKAHG